MIKNNNILFLLHLPPPVHGSSVVGKAIKESVRINEAFETNYINLLVSRTVNETGKGSFIKVFRFIGVWFKLLMVLSKKKPALCYMALTATGAAFYKDVLLVALLRLFHVKRVYHLHNKGVSKHQSGSFNKVLYRFVFQDAEVLLLSQHLYADIQRFVPQLRVHICPNGVSDTAFNLIDKGVRSLQPVKILFLSNLIASKGVFVLLDACAILQQKGMAFACDFIGGEGDVSEEQLNQKIKEKKLTSQVRYFGKKYGEEKQQAFANAEIFVLPTYYFNECFPLVLLEAMQYSLPIVSTYEGGIPDVVEDGKTGFLVPQQNVVAIANKLERLIKDASLRQQMGAAGRNKYEQEFTLEIFENRMVTILQSILNNNPC